MALKSQPYLPLYVDDFLADEKLSLCSAEATGVYIRLMCLMHKMEEYGVVSLGRLDKSSDDPIQNFACLLSRLMPYETDQIYRSISELLERKVIQIKGEKLMQKRMISDAELSKKRAIAGRTGGKQKPSKISSKTQSKSEANTGIGIGIVNGTVIKNRYGEFNNVLLTDEEMSKLQSDVPCYERYIEDLSGYMASKGTKYKSHYATIRQWAARDKKEGKSRTQSTGNVFLDMLKEETG